MNCNEVQKLLPLYIGRDLKEKRAKLVMAHVQTCPECAGSVDEYRETRELLQQFAPPPFSEEVYAGIRQHVLHEIELEAAAPGLSGLLVSLFRPRIRWAVASALLVAVSGFAFYYIANRKADPPNLSNDRQQLADGRGKVVGPPSTSTKESEAVLPATVKKVRPVPGLAAGTNQYQRPKATSTARARSRPATVSSADNASMAAEASPERSNVAEPDSFPAPDAVTSEKPLRVEMQTKDPNIRIIWFTPQPTKQGSPNKFSKGI